MLFAVHPGDHVLVINLDFCGDWAGSVFPGGEEACVGYVKDPNNIPKLEDQAGKNNVLFRAKYVLDLVMLEFLLFLVLFVLKLWLVGT